MGIRQHVRRRVIILLNSNDSFKPLMMEEVEQSCRCKRGTLGLVAGPPYLQQHCGNANSKLAPQFVLGYCQAAGADCLQAAPVVDDFRRSRAGICPF